MTSRALTRTEQAVLGLLVWKGERSGYDLHAIAGRSLGYIWTPTRSQLYSVLPRLAKAGLARSRTIEQQTRPDKHLYAPTAAGRREFDRWLAHVDDLAPEDRDGVLLKVFFGALAPPGASAAQLAAYRAGVVDRLRTYEAVERRIADGDPHQLATLRMGLALMHATLTWVDETAAALMSAGCLDVAPG